MGPRQTGKMTTPTTSPDSPPWIFEQLRRGATYRVATRSGSTVGEFLGIETPHGEWAILIRHTAGTDSIPCSLVTSIESAAA